MRRLSDTELQEWCLNEGEPTFVSVVDGEDSQVSWITKSPDLSLQEKRDSVRWAKVLTSDKGVKDTLRKIGAKQSGPSLLFKYPEGKSMTVSSKTWTERFEVSNWIDAVLTEDRLFMGYDTYGDPVEDDDSRDVHGFKLINHRSGVGNRITEERAQLKKEIH